MATAGFISQLGSDVQSKQEATAKQQRDDALALRERHADQIQQAITGFQSDPELTDSERQFKISEAQKQLTSLYQPTPEDGHALFTRLRQAIHGTPPPVTIPGTSAGTTAAVQTRTPAMSVAPGVNIPSGPTTQVELHPGMTMDEVLSAGSPAAVKGHAQAAALDQAKQTWQQITGQPMDADTLEELARARTGLPQEKQSATKQHPIQQLVTAGLLKPEDAPKAARIAVGLEPRETDKPDKVMEPDIKGTLFMGVNDPANGKKYSRADLESGNAPKEALAIYKDYKSGKAEQSAEEDRKEAFSLQKQANAIGAAMAKSDYTKARAAVDKGKDAYVDALTRSNTMDQNIKDAQAGSQQAMLSLVANHIGMTLGAQKGARITRSVWDEAMASAPWLDTVAAKWFHDDANGDKVFDGYKGGVNLTGDQMKQMVDLAHQRRDVLKQNIDTIQQMYGDDLAVGEKAKQKAAAGGGKVTSISAGSKGPKRGASPSDATGDAAAAPKKKVYQPGDVVTTKSGKRLKIVAVRPDGKYDTEPVP